MSTLEAKPVKAKKILNTKLLPIAALLLVLLALLFLAGPLIRPAGGALRAGNFVSSGNSQGTGTQVQISGTNARQLAIGGGRGQVIVFFVMLLVSLAAAVGMLYTKRWGQVLAIILGILYGLFGLVSLLPLLFIRLVGAPNPISLILGVVHLLLAVAVIVLASIPGKPALVPLAATASANS